MEEAEFNDYKHMENLMAAQTSILDHLDPGGALDDSFNVMDDGEIPSRDEVIPCSIRCPEMPGEIPTLQCKRCLCLYHAECLGFTGALDTANFVCSVSLCCCKLTCFFFNEQLKLTIILNCAALF